MRVLQLMASPFFGGPERQVLGLARALRPDVETSFATFAEGGKAEDFARRARDAGFACETLRTNWPNLIAAAREVAELLRRTDSAVVVTNGYKPDILGLIGARLAGRPAVAIAHGWTGATWKVRLNERLDAWVMRRFDRIVGVSAAMSRRLVASGAPPARVVTIPNAIDTNHLAPRSAEQRETLESMFPRAVGRIVVAAGRLSPEKGFDVLVDACGLVLPARPDVGVIVFGAGPLEADLRTRIGAAGLGDQMVLGGFRDDLDRLGPQADLFALSSRTEGLPVALLEAMGAGVPAVATDVGGVAEVMRDGVDGRVVPPGDPEAFACALAGLLDDDEARKACARSSGARVAEHFTHRLQAERFAALFREVIRRPDQTAETAGERESTRW